MVHRLHALFGGAEVRRKAAARELARRTPAAAAELVQEVIQLARAGSEGAACVLTAIVSAIEREASVLPHAAQLARLARASSLMSVAALFPEGEARQELDPDEAARHDARLFSQSLGFLKTQARLTRSPDLLARLATVSNAAVIRNVLLNPRLTEEHVVRIAARRPARPEPLVEIWRSERWSTRHPVRRALAFNPYLPPEVGAKIVPLLTTKDLKELAGDPGVHASLREQAKLLLEASKIGGRSPGA
ncbi:MAG: hypothetical protein HYZ28_15960 [Myxococcales bacterium]|nr:hypothetical protein [Myxococcales bacterium]